MDIRKGFTLIELVIVIVILGILAAFIVPRFASLSREARIGTVSSLEGAMRSASSIVHSLAITNNQNGATGSVTMEDGTAVATVWGYPSTAAGIAASLQSTSGFSAAVAGTYTKDGAPTPANCSVVYAQPTGANLPPSFTSTTTGC